MTNDGDRFWQQARSALNLSALVGLDDHYAAFVELADRLEMPRSERAGILDIDEIDLPHAVETLRAREETALRRLIYAIPLMQRQLDSFG